MDIKYELPTIVRIRRQKGKIIQNCDIYIGRKCSLGGWNLEQSIWHNPYIIKDEKERSNCLAQYKKYITNNTLLMSKLHELSGKILGCWCKPNACHGDVLIELFKEKFM